MAEAVAAARPARPALRLGRAPLAGAIGAAALFALALAVRHAARQPGLLYPDGYQYLLMARGIGEHLRPVTRLGPGGELFVPSVDAAAKPLFPALVALVSAFGLHLRSAAALVTLAASAATPVVTAALALRLTRSWLGAAAAGAAVLASPALARWSGFSGPDALGATLALAAALALAERRAATGGVLAALAIACRPELLVLAGGAALAAALAPTGPVRRDARSEPGRARSGAKPGPAVALWRPAGGADDGAAGPAPALRPLAGRAAFAGAMTIAFLLGVLRPPLGLPAGAALLPAGIVAAAVLLAAAWRVGPRPRAATAAAAAVIAAVAAAAALRVPALRELASGEWALLAGAALGLVAATATGHGRPALLIAAAAAVLGAAYAAKNPHSVRYLSLLVPLAALLLAHGLAPARTPVAVRLAALALAAAALVHAPPQPAAVDAFARTAARIPAGRTPLVSAAPDAYGLLLPDRPQRLMRPGARGLILLDAAQRAYLPGLRARGRVVARIPAAAPFERPDGRADARGAVLVRGRVRPAGRPGGYPAAP